ncbi:formimidoylglutamase [Vibrio panuliri]|uniref:Formimidoylglutamase n=1 Tax=Vibrio panuliri TaxID=1381081 RepID=A0A1Q9HF42_9VIBR|nr:formimidoylglutamase [Vibrio panuliri]OLQ88321.1 formimidoylglutamase [Vibrio panuliri]
MSNPPITQQDFHWQGRVDEEDALAAKRVHSVIKKLQVSELEPYRNAVSILGFASDAGVARNKGRVGARKAPDLIRRALANMAWHKESRLIDLGTVVCDDDLLEQAQSDCADVIALALRSTPVITLGGGHEVAWASFLGLARYFEHLNPNKAPRIGIINFDAHFDLRAFEHPSLNIKPSSGTAFNQIQHYCQAKQWPFHYACLGVSRACNTTALFNRANELNVWYVEDKDLSHLNHVYHLTQLQHFIDNCDYIYLTIDLDVFPAAIAPGVSAPAARGISLDTINLFLDRILHYQDKLVIADIAEYNPTYDVDSQTARLAARLCWDIANAFSEQ